MADNKHKNDIYGDLSKTKAEEPATPAATVVLLRDTDSGPEVLMLKKNARIDFGGMWVFPGGRIDEEDYPSDRDLESAARTAAARETIEEANVPTKPDDFVWFAHWTPPASTPRRYATWFFVAHTETNNAVEIDGGEIHDHAWIRPSEALQEHTAGNIDLAPPTWVTLYHLSQYAPAQEILNHFRSNEPKIYETHVAQRNDGVRVAMWLGDAGYADYDADADGARHRLVMPKEGFTFENDVEDY